MKKHLIYLLAVSPLLCFGDSSGFPYRLQSLSIYKFTNSSGSGQQVTTQSAGLTNLEGYENIQNYIYAYTARQTIGFSCPLGNVSAVPSMSTTLSTSAVALSRPFQVVTTNNEVFTTGWGLVAPDVYALYCTLARLYASGYRNYEQIFLGSGSAYLNFTPNVVISDVLTGTNTAWRSSLLSALSQINASLQGINTGIQNIHVDVGQLQSDYTSVNQLALNPSSFSYNDMPVINGSSVFSYEAASVLSDPSVSPALKSQFAANLGRVYGDYLSKAAQVYALDQGDPNSPSYGKSFSDFLSDSAGVSKSMQYQYSTPLTNGMQRMTTDWKNAVTNDLAKNTASITNQLAQWKRDLHDDIVDGVSAPLSSVITDNGGANSVRVEANITGGQMTINGGSIEVGDLSIGRITDGMDGIQGAIQQALADWLDEWYDWAYRNPDSWSEFYRRFYAEFGPDVITNQLLQVSLLTGVTNELHTAAWTNELVGIISNGVAGLNLSITNELWDYYYDRFKKSNEFKDDSGAPFSLDLFRQQVFGGGFDESKYRQLDWFSRVELLLYQIGYASTNDAPEVADLEGEFDDMEEELSTASSDFVAASVKVVSVFALVRRFANSVALAFQSSAAPSSGGIVLLNGGSWLVNEPLVLKVPVQVQNAMRLVFQCIWYLSAFVIAWRVLVFAWGRIVSIVRWLWSVFDV